jgi:hypothetical protein
MYEIIMYCVLLLTLVKGAIQPGNNNKLFQKTHEILQKYVCKKIPVIICHLHVLDVIDI